MLNKYMHHLQQLCKILKIVVGKIIRFLCFVLNQPVKKLYHCNL